MKPLLLCLALFWVSGQSLAMSSTAMTDLSLGSTTDSLESTSDATSDDDDKWVLAARNDAAQYVASGGQQRGVYLEAALQHLRQQHPEWQASDMQLAQAILSR